MVQYRPNEVPEHPGSHMNIDLICTASQKIAVCTDMFSLFTTAILIEDEKRERLEQSLVRLITPIRNASTVIARVDNAPAFKSLSKSASETLEQNKIKIELGHHANKNSNAVVDKIIQELENELIKIAPNGGKSQ